MKTDIYQRVTDQIIASLETGIRPWMQPWSGEHAAGRITRPLRGNGIPYQGINILMLWGAVRPDLDDLQTGACPWRRGQEG